MLLFLFGGLFIMVIQPMVMISLMIFIVLMYSYIIYSMMGSYWFGYGLLMVMLSGVLVIFTYMISLLPNESFESYNLVYIFIFMLFFMGYYYYSFCLDFSYITVELWMSYISIFNLFMVSFLLSIMLMVVWFSYINVGAIRIIN